jgi:hypothetical protein
MLKPSAEKFLAGALADFVWPFPWTMPLLFMDLNII